MCPHMWHIPECATIVLGGWAALAVTQLSGASSACHCIGLLWCSRRFVGFKLTFLFLSPIFSCVL